MSSCLTPFIVKHNGDDLPVPCGKCPNCRARRISGWSFRLMQHDKKAYSSHFITLTYATSSIPISGKGRLTLRPTDLQLFFKRLRKLHGKAHNLATPIKYFAVGEYGGKTWRPHYHIIVFNCKPELIHDAWQKGQVHYGTVTGASVGYTLKYISKPKRIPQYNGDDRHPEFQRSSQKLGLDYLTPQILDWYRAHYSRMALHLEGGKKAAMPRYYKLKIYDEYQRSVFGNLLRMDALAREAIEIRRAGGPEAYADQKVKTTQGAYAAMLAKDLQDNL